MEKVLAIVEQLQGTSGRNDKEFILKQNEGNELFKKVMHFIYNPYILTGISKKKISKKLKLPKEPSTSSIIEIMDYLQSHNSGRDEDIIFVQHFIKSQPVLLRDFYTKIVSKDLSIGLTDGTLNKVYGDFIPVFDVMLAKKFEEHSHKIKGNYIITEKLDGCFEGNMKVNMADGSYKKIKDVEIGDMVLSFNENTKIIETKKVINKFNNGKKSIDQWYKIQLRDNVTSSRYYKRVIATHNHKILTANGWNAVKNIKSGDYIYIYDYVPSYEQQQILLGSILADTAINKDTSESKFGRFQLGRAKKYPHGTLFDKQKELFSNFIFCSGERMSGYGSEINYANINSIPSLPKYFYNNDNIRKSSYKLNKEILSNLDALGLAMFYLDDGNKRPCKEDGDEYAKNVAPRCSFSVYKFPYEEIVNFQKYLERKFYIESEIRKDKFLKNGEQSYRLDINKDSTKIFFDLIAKYIPKEMRYKLGTEWHNIEEYKWWEHKGKNELLQEEVLNVSNYKSNYIKNLNAYDLEIEDNHTYIIEDFAVHNCRLAVIKDNGVVKSFTRQGKQYEGLEEIESDIANLPFDNIVFDGELIADIQGSTIEVYAETTSKARSKGANKTGLVFHIFDMLKLKDFQSGKSQDNCVKRKSYLSSIFENNKLPHCKEVKPLYIGSDLSEVEKWMIRASEQSWEGLMVNMDKPYICKRSDSILKVKVMSTCDVKVISFEEGTGKYEGKLGAMLVDYKGFNCGVGSGFTDADREYIWNHQEEYLGKIVEVQYFEESKNAQGGISLRFPVFKKLRLDKTLPSYN